MTCYKSKAALAKNTIVKLQSQVQTSVLGLGVDFVLPLSQQQEQEEGPPPKVLH